MASAVREIQVNEKDQDNSAKSCTDLSDVLSRLEVIETTLKEIECNTRGSEEHKLVFRDLSDLVSHFLIIKRIHEFTCKLAYWL